MSVAFTTNKKSHSNTMIEVPSLELTKASNTPLKLALCQERCLEATMALRLLMEMRARRLQSIVALSHGSGISQLGAED